MNEIAPGVWRWTAPHPEWRPAHEWGHEVAGFALQLRDALLVIDPQAPPEGSTDEAVFWSDLDALLGDRPTLAILITIPYHVRSSAALYSRYRECAGVTVWGHPVVRRRLGRTTPLEPVEPGKQLPGGCEAFAIGSPRRQEMPLYLPSHRALAFGDTVVGVDGQLRIWESPDRGKRPWYRDRFLPTLRPLLDLDVEHALVTHGPPVIGDGRRELQRALAAPPWSMSAR